MVSEEELDERKMINEGIKKNPFPFFIWLALIAAIAALLWGSTNWVMQKRANSLSGTPFLQVTNRDFSLFLWQYPEYMRANVSSKNAYLPGFQYLDKVSIEEGKEEQFVTAPPKVLFLYHTWDRLVRNEFTARPIKAKEFREFLEYAPEWSPAVWKASPKGYQELYATLGNKSDESLNLAEIPVDVQAAFIGWKNYFLEGALIKNVKPTFEEMREFLNSHPNYSRNLWRNIVMDGRPDYLIGISSGDSKGVIPEGQLVAFLKVAFFNASQAKKGL